MDLSLSPAEREFRDAVRGWIEANHPGREPDSDPELFEFRRPGSGRSTSAAGRG